MKYLGSRRLALVAHCLPFLFMACGKVASVDGREPNANDAEDGSVPEPSEPEDDDDTPTPSDDDAEPGPTVSEPDPVETPIEGGPGNAPDAGCPAILGPDDVEEFCIEEGALLCLSGCAYECPEDEGEEEPVWQRTDSVACPLWSAEECDAAIEEVWSLQGPCGTDDDCSLWGGVEEGDACENVHAPRLVSVSALTPAEDAERARALYDDAFAGGCRAAPEYDTPPPRAVCDAERCRFVDREPACGARPVEPPPDAGPDLGTLDAGYDAGAPDSGADAGASLDAG
jgi:hypothetical protein